MGGLAAGELEQGASLMAAGVVLLAVLGVGVQQLVRMLRGRRNGGSVGPDGRVMDAVMATVNSNAEWRAELTHTMRNVAETTGQLSRELRDIRLEMRQTLAVGNGLLAMLDVRLGGAQEAILGSERALQQIEAIHQEVVVKGGGTR